MDINVTLIGQMITFAVFIWFTMKFIWPHITKAMHDREKKIADGLAAAEKGKRDLELAQHKSVEILQETKLKASQIVDAANKRGVHIVEEAKEAARKESKRLIASAQIEIEQQTQQVKDELRAQAGNLAVKMAGKIVAREIDPKAHQTLLDKMVEAL